MRLPIWIQESYILLKNQIRNKLKAVWNEVLDYNTNRRTCKLYIDNEIYFDMAKFDELDFKWNFLVRINKSKIRRIYRKKIFIWQRKFSKKMKSKGRQRSIQKQTTEKLQRGRLPRVSSEYQWINPTECQGFTL